MLSSRFKHAWMKTYGTIDWIFWKFYLCFFWLQWKFGQLNYNLTCSWIRKCHTCARWSPLNRTLTSTWGYLAIPAPSKHKNWVWVGFFWTWQNQWELINKLQNKWTGRKPQNHLWFVSWGLVRALVREMSFLQIGQSPSCLLSNLTFKVLCF